jgi:hypothetical protein
MKQYLFAVLCFSPMLVQAEIYKAVDADGHVTYSSSPIAGGKKLNLEPLPTMLPPAKGSEFPRVDSQTQRGRDDTRRKILQDELDAEKKLLKTATQNLSDAASNPDVYRGQDGKTYRNVAAYDAKVQPLQDEIDLHTRNIQAIETELSRMSK